jgi:hypothetical protein
MNDFLRLASKSGDNHLAGTAPGSAVDHSQSTLGRLQLGPVQSQWTPPTTSDASSTELDMATSYFHRTKVEACWQRAHVPLTRENGSKPLG